MLRDYILHRSINNPEIIYCTDLSIAIIVDLKRAEYTELPATNRGFVQNVNSILCNFGGYHVQTILS